MDSKLQSIKKRIFRNAKPEVRNYLSKLDAFCSPAAFWYSAWHEGLCSMQELKLAKQYYSEQWYYAGD
ncbi:MAG: hypothetical protein JRD89_10900 [Deltaproteobacteria bacterium]|nr:hypothetical protein [Deltaproteobacteria bacterium]